MVVYADNLAIIVSGMFPSIMMKYGGIPFKQNATYDIYRQGKGTGILLAAAKWIKINTFFQCVLSLVLVISFEDDPSPPLFADE